MAENFWIRKWQENDIRFHQSAPHPTLVREFATLSPGRVLVPLCGKSLDLVWLRAQGHQVIGAELSPIACRDFFEENQLAYERVPAGAHEIYRGDRIEIWCGDFFTLPDHVFSGITDLYDRAALIALPPELRERYTALIKRHLAGMSPSAQLLLITVEYAEGVMQGPPFSVPESEVRRHYADVFPRIERLYCEKDDDLSARGSRGGATSPVSEAAYLMNRTP